MSDTDGVAPVRQAVENVIERILDEEEYLTELDSQIGDADFGTNIARGMNAVSEELASTEFDSPTGITTVVAEQLLSEMAGSSGALYGDAILKAGRELDTDLSEESIVSAAEAYRDAIRERGDVEVGAKTMYDAVVPTVDVLKRSVEVDDLTPAEISARCVAACRRGVMFTTPLRASKGRASYVDWRSVGHPDPGAVCTLCIVQELHRTVQDVTGETVEPTLGDGFD